MKIYFGHSKGFDYKNELYKPIRESSLSAEHEIILPHEKSDGPINSKAFLKTCDLMIAEVSYPATGLGIELGWADFLGVPILCVYKSDAKVSSSAKLIAKNVIKYDNPQDLVEKLTKFI